MTLKLKFDMIGLFVKDMKKMVEFYQEVVGLKVNWDGESPYAEFEHEGIRFAFYERAKLPELMDGYVPTYPSGLNGTFELAIDLPHFEDVEGVFRKFVLGGADPINEPRMEPWGMQSSMVADPEGNLLEIGSWNKGSGSEEG